MKEMSTRPSTTGSDSLQSTPAASATPDYSRPLAIVTTLFFMWGFLTCLNDILVPHLKSIFDLSYARAMLDPVCVLLGLLLILRALVEDREYHRL